MFLSSAYPTVKENDRPNLTNIITIPPNYITQVCLQKINSKSKKSPSFANWTRQLSTSTWSPTVFHVIIILCHRYAYKKKINSKSKQSPSFASWTRQSSTSTWSSIAFLYAKSIQPVWSPLAPYLKINKGFAGEWGRWKKKVKNNILA